MSSEYRIGEVRKRSNIVELNYLEGKSEVQIMGGEEETIRLEGITHPRHPLYKSIDAIRRDFIENRDVTLKIGDREYTDYKIVSFVWEETGGDPETRRFIIDFMKVR